MLPWVRYLLLLFVARTVSSNESDEGLNLLEYYEKNKEVSPLKILLQDDKFLRKNAEKHGYINGEWAGLLANSTTTTPCSENPRLNNPDCIKNGKRSYFSSLQDNRNADKYNFGWPRVSPALVHTEKYILGKRTKENFRHRELEITADRNVIETQREIETKPAKRVDDKQQQTEHSITNSKVVPNKKNSINLVNEIVPYGRVDFNGVNSTNDTQTNDNSNNMVTDDLKGMDKNLINETSIATHSNTNESDGLKARVMNDSEKNNANSSYNEKLKELPAESIPDTDPDPPGRIVSPNINYNNSSHKYKDTSHMTEPTLDKMKEVSSNGFDAFNMRSYGDTPSRTEQPQDENISQIEMTKSESADPYGAGNKSVNVSPYPSSVNGVIDGMVESHRNKTPEFQKSVFSEKTQETNLPSEVGTYGLVEPTDLNVQNITGESVFIPANNGSFSSRNQQFQELESNETPRKTHSQNVTYPYSLSDLTILNDNNISKVDGVINSQLPPNKSVQVDNDNRERSFGPLINKQFSDKQLNQHTESKTNSNTELGPYGLIDPQSVNEYLKPEDTTNTSSVVNTPFIQYTDKKSNNSLNTNSPNILIPQENASRNKTSDHPKNTLQNGEKIGPYASDFETPKSDIISNSSENNEDKLFEGEVNLTSGAAEPTFKILHHARVGNYSSIQSKIADGNNTKELEVISENGKDILPSDDGDKKYSACLLKNNASKNENVTDGQLPPDSDSELASVIPDNYTTLDAQLNSSSLILECPVKLCYCDSGKPITGFKLIPF